MKILLIVFIILVLILFLSFIYNYYVMKNVKTPKYTVQKKSKNIELRQYEPMLTAYVVVSGDKKKSINTGFRLLANYIFGNNIAMTSPVTQQSSGKKISMTSPVMQQGFEQGTWRITFVMPNKYTINTIPQPKNKKIFLEAVPAKQYIVIRFSGRGGALDLAAYTDKLLSYVKAQQLQIVGKPIFAFYNPPWTLPFLRRNEVMYQVKSHTTV